ncbi:NADH-quinone oxidoreductase subunit J [Pseudoroseomonas ludipueritiae]|uniref:NADH-quinone oxidoreductase subunit J n=1 Tax=Pseudoroseomonas ludipueritiae TaxID=198093 RepID=A0ABR7R407_9PROT|nr:NADH-quinone oxidoreductase subunit J [Pseudoroseomonas ludipueritiae]MBC9176463.1 NADH-quinone oxidoreductase subunit J [Pseudoroseomonas ludipueritiae]MCG7363553.1 NADH-quinone oxidoreductase subunit J [Roseomonas sp. ACRSG]
MIATLAFYVFAFILIASAVMVVTSRNPVHSVLYLILAFMNAAALFLIAGAEFLAMILAIVYVGAVAVLFLFVVMMLDIDFAQLRAGFQRYLPFGAIIGGILFLELLFVFGSWQFAEDAGSLRLNAMPAAADGVTNTEAIGRILYTDYIFLFQGSGLILLVAMIGAIVLTLREKAPNSRRQNIAVQVARAEAVPLENVPARTGLGVLGIKRRPLPEAAKPKAVAHDDHGHHGGGHH